ncbi:MAG: hypothetical protein EBX87_04005 [Actinobacteria bacterium]|nr:hypothetical protein [Actinomycetota bacterium]
MSTRHSVPVETVMPTPSDNASAAAELAALVDAVEACRTRLSALAERRNAALRGDGDDADSLLVSIFEAERGLSTAIRLLQRAVRSAR